MGSLVFDYGVWRISKWSYPIEIICGSSRIQLRTFSIGRHITKGATEHFEILVQYPDVLITSTRTERAE